ncbi:unnamed protein product, partial [Sphacelaria rigidula]
NFGGRAECGTHNFPYAILLPPNLPSSMKESSGDGSSCSIRYKLNARVHRPGMLKFDAKAEAEFTVFSRTQEASLAPVLVGPTTEKVTECCCVKKGSMSIGFQADKSVVGRLERLGLTVVARNDSTAPVKELRIEINQKAHWNAHGYKASKQRTVAKLIVSGSQLGPVGEGAAERPDRDRGFAAVGQDARAEL